MSFAIRAQSQSHSAIYLVCHTKAWQGVSTGAYCNNCRLSCSQGFAPACFWIAAAEKVCQMPNIVLVVHLGMVMTQEPQHNCPDSPLGTVLCSLLVLCRSSVQKAALPPTRFRSKLAKVLFQICLRLLACHQCCNILCVLPSSLYSR